MDQLLGSCTTHSTGTSSNLFGLLFQTILAAQCGLSPPEKWPQDYATTALEKGLSDYDFIIIGAGSAGSVLANRLTEIPDWKVLLLEAGGDPPIESEIPFFMMALINTTNTWNRYVESDGHVSTAYPKGSYWPSGRMLGGSSAVNAMLYVRGNRDDYDEWERLGNPTWEWENVLEYFKKSEDTNDQSLVEKDNGKYHAQGGLQKVRRYNGNDQIKGAIVDAAKSKGYKYLEDLNADEHVGFARAVGTLFDGKRYSTAKAFLNPAKDRPNLHIIKNAFVTKVIIDDGKATGVKFEVSTDKGVKRMKATARKEVIVSAGTVNTAKLLQLSGIGRKDLLEQFEIPVKKDAAVGHNLQDHIMVPITFSYEKGTATPFNSKEFFDYYYQYLMGSIGMFSTFGIGDLLGFVNTKNETAEFPDVQFSFVKYERGSLPGLGAKLGLSPEIEEVMADANKHSHVLHVFVVLLRQSDRGRVELSSIDPHEPPKIFANYLQSEDDVQTLVNGIKIFRNLVKTPAMKQLKVKDLKLPHEECDELEYDSDEYWRCAVRRLATTLYHPVGTAKMGPDSDTEAVVDYDLGVKGIAGLRVVDASIMPISPRGPTNAATIMIAEKASDFIKETWTKDESVRDEL